MPKLPITELYPDDSRSLFVSNQYSGMYSDSERTNELTIRGHRGGCYSLLIVGYVLSERRTQCASYSIEIPVADGAALAPFPCTHD